MADVNACRMFLLNRFYFGFKHDLVKENGKLVKDTYYDSYNWGRKVCYFYYNFDKPDYKIITELIVHKDRNIRRKIDYKIDYKGKTERHIHKDENNFIYLDLKYFFSEIEGKLELLRVNQYQNCNIIGCHFFRDVNNVKLNRSLYIPKEDIPIALKLTKEELEEHIRPVPFEKLCRKDCDLSAYH